MLITWKKSGLLEGIWNKNTFSLSPYMKNELFSGYSWLSKCSYRATSIIFISALMKWFLSWSEGRPTKQWNTSFSPAYSDSLKKTSWCLCLLLLNTMGRGCALVWRSLSCMAIHFLASLSWRNFSFTTVSYCLAASLNSPAYDTITSFCWLTTPVLTKLWKALGSVTWNSVHNQWKSITSGAATTCAACS